MLTSGGRAIFAGESALRARIGAEPKIPDRRSRKRVKAGAGSHLRQRSLAGLLAVLATTLLASAGCTTAFHSKSSPAVPISALVPGEYELVVRAREGTRKWSSAAGRLWLLPAPADWSEAKRVGRTDVDFAKVGAPIFPSDGPDPRSDDPAAPGVVVLLSRGHEHHPPDTPVLVIGTASNTRASRAKTPEGLEIIQVSFDGAGIGLWVERVFADGFGGHWEEWGIFVDGRGDFRATRRSAR